MGWGDSRSAEVFSIVYDALNSSVNGVIITTLEGRIIYVNPSFLRMFGYGEKAEVLDKNAADLFSAEEVKKFSDIETIIREARGETREFFARHRHGTRFPVEVSSSRITDRSGNIVGRMASFIDIRARKRLERDLRDSERKLRHLSRRLLDAQEEERKLVARELHDAIGSSLANIKYSLEKSLEDLSGAAAPERDSLEQVISLVQDAIRDTSRISRSLRPAILDDLGVLAAIRWFCRGFQEVYPDIRIANQADIKEGEVAEPLKIVIYRVLQEALNNAAKHSGADTVYVSLRKTRGNLELSIRDNGRGFDPEEVSSEDGSSWGMGLDSMRERTEFSGGSFAIQTGKGRGTTVRALWPLG